MKKTGVVTEEGRFKFTAPALGASIVALGIAVISQTILTSDALTRQALGRVEYSASLAVSRINGWLESQIGYLNGLVRDLAWIMGAYDEEEIRSIIRSHYQNDDAAFFQIYLGYPDGSFWFPAAWDIPEDLRADERDWYRGAVGNPQKVFVSSPYTDLHSRQVCVTLAKAVLRDGEILAVVGADIYLSGIRRIVGETPIAEGQGFAILVDIPSGVIMVHPDPLIAPEEGGEYRTIHESYNGVYRELLEAEDGESIFIVGYDGTRRYCNSQTIPAAPWKFFSLVNQDTIVIPIRRQTWSQIFMSVVVLLLIGALIYVAFRAMRRAAQTAKEHSDMKTTFLANMSHEIRTPMNGIIGFAELALENAGLGDQTRDYLEKIRNSVKDLLSILNDILDVSKIEAGKVSLEKIPFDLHDVIAACESTISGKAAEKGIGLYVYSEPVLEYKLLGDPTRLRQVLLNLLSNAVKFTNVGTVKLMVTVEKIHGDRAILHFEVKDSGIGMNAAEIAKIFKPFEQADRSTTRKYGGTGLGLTISRNLVERMGGKLGVESAPGIGSKFSFTLEFGLSGEKTGNREREGDSPGTLQRPRLTGRILVCEDNPMNQDLIRDHLLRLGLEADLRENGLDGLEAVRASLEQGRPYDLIFMDIHMPVMDGLEASSEIKRLDCPSPIVALTANVLTRDTDIYYRYGIAGHLAKPFTTRELWDCLSRYLRPLPGPGEEAKSGSPPALDYQAGLDLTGGDRQLYEKLRRDFHSQYKNFMGEFLGLLREDYPEAAETEKEGRIATAHRMAHSLKSSAALIGAEALRSAAASVEASLKAGWVDPGGAELKALEENLARALAELGDSLARA
jgi:signal transduction histidine kinase/HPt (histidine-containing phosphotransfer) domain-containing protein